MWLAKSTMANLGRQISGKLGKPVVDGTGLKGEFEIRMYWVQDSGMRDSAALERDAGPLLSSAIQE
jgi:uncharacterized protein (TIGR03435 family)